MSLRPCWHPVLAGVVIGIVMLLTFVTAGRGMGVSGMMARLVATVQHWFIPDLTEESTYFSQYFAHGTHPLNDYLTFLVVGLVAGAFFGASSCRDFRFEVRRGPRISAPARLVLALLGGGIAGFAARLARGCASGQALVGGAELSVGSWVFMICMFAGGFATAWFVRKQWI